jgi:hypothetical protein
MRIAERNEKGNRLGKLISWLIFSFPDPNFDFERSIKHNALKEGYKHPC